MGFGVLPVHPRKPGTVMARRIDPSRCELCSALEHTHDQEMDAYLHLVEQQVRSFRAGNVRAGRDMDAAIQAAKTRWNASVSRLLAHGAEHRPAASFWRHVAIQSGPNP